LEYQILKYRRKSAVWTTVSQCLSDEVKSEIENEILGFLGKLSEVGNPSKNWSGHLNLIVGGLSKSIMSDLENQRSLQYLEDFFKIRLEGKEVILGINLNMPGSKPQHIHMDGSFEEEHHILNITLVDTDITNGAIEIFPNTDLMKLNYGQFLFKGLKKGGVRVETKSGCGLLRTSRLWHRGMPNLTNVCRPMLSVVFHDRDTPEGRRIAANRDSLTRGPIRMSPTQWFYPGSSRLRDAQHFVYANMPVVHDCYRLTKALFGRNSNF